MIFKFLTIPSDKSRVRAIKVTCRVIDKKWITPTVVQIRFTTSKRIRFHAGQFLSMLIKSHYGDSKPLRRAYSFSLSPDQPYYELCVKHVENGPGSTYVSKLRLGETFEASAPFGDFVYHPRPGRNVCFICTGTGIAPFRAMVLSQEFEENRPEKAYLLFGARTEKEILYASFFKEQGVMPVIAVSRPGAQFVGYKGRVTDCLRALPDTWDWFTTDFYICGNGDMVMDVKKILTQSRGIKAENIFAEMYYVSNGVIDPITGTVTLKAA